MKKYSTFSTKYLYLKLVFITLTAVLVGLLTVSTTLATRQLIDAVFLGEKVADALINYAILIVCMIIAMALNAYLSSITDIKTSLSMRASVLRAIFTKDIRTIASYHSGDLLNRAFSDSAIYTNGLVDAIPSLCHAIVKVVYSIVILYVIEPIFAYAMIVLLPIVYLLSVLYGRVVFKRHKQIQESESISRAFFSESIQNMSLMRGVGVEDKVYQRFDTIQRDNHHYKLMLAIISVTMNVVTYAGIMGIYYLVMCVGADSVSAGAITYGSMIALLQLVLQFQTPIKSLPSLVSRLSKMRVSKKRIDELTRLPDVVDMRVEDITFDKMTLREVSYSYEENTPVISGLSMTINKGDFVGIAGESGAGKTTLIKLIMGLYEPTSGEIVVNSEGVDISNRLALFAYVPQGNMVFSGTIRDNVKFFNEDISDEKVRDILRICCLDQLVDTLDNGLDTYVGERGYGLSEGQVQRLCVARALAMDRQILLLDEATSALDVNTERQMIENIKNIGKTVILITHHQDLLNKTDYNVIL